MNKIIRYFNLNKFAENSYRKLGHGIHTSRANNNSNIFTDIRPQNQALNLSVLFVIKINTNHRAKVNGSLGNIG